MHRILYLTLLLSIFSSQGYGSDSLWNLKRCIKYGQNSNPDVRVRILESYKAQRQLLLSKLSLLPSVNFNSSYGRNFGRSINPTTNQFENRSYEYTGLNAGGSVIIFGGLNKQHNIKKDRLLMEIAKANLAQAEDDIALNIADAYLQVLQAKDQIRLSQNKILLSIQQVNNTGQLLNIGRSNGQDFAQVKSQLSLDSSSLLKAQLNYQLAIIDIKSLLTLDFEEEFIPDDFNIQALKTEVLSVKPQEIYLLAENHIGKLKSSALGKLVAKQNLKIAKAALFPQLSINVSSGTNYSSTYFESLPNGELSRMAWGKQIRNNLAQSYSVGLSIPLFNGMSQRYAIKQAAVDLWSSSLNYDQEKIQLKQKVYKAYYDAQTALQSYYAAVTTERFTKTAFEFATKRYEKGLISALEMLITQNQANEAEINVSNTKYDLAFKILVIDYYLGNDL